MEKSFFITTIYNVKSIIIILAFDFKKKSYNLKFQIWNHYFSSRKNPFYYYNLKVQIFNYYFPSGRFFLLLQPEMWSLQLLFYTKKIIYSWNLKFQLWNYQYLTFGKIKTLIVMWNFKSKIIKKWDFWLIWNRKLKT